MVVEEEDLEWVTPSMVEETSDKTSDEAKWAAAMKEARDEMWTPVKEEANDDMSDAAATERVCMYAYMYVYALIYVCVCTCVRNRHIPCVKTPQ